MTNERRKADAKWKRLVSPRKEAQPKNHSNQFAYRIGLIRCGQQVIEVTTKKKRMGEMITEIAMQRRIKELYPCLAA